MARGVRQAAPATHPQLGGRAVAAEQTELQFPVGAEAVDQAIADLYRALGSAVDAEGGVVAFAALMERSVPDVSRRVARADHKGERKRAHLDYLAHLGPEGREAFLRALAASWGYLPPERRRLLTDAERLAIVAGELPERRRRQLEREHSLPAGSLDP